MIVTIIFTAFLCLYSASNCAAASLVPEGIDRTTVVEFGKKLVTDTLDLNYLTAQEIVVGIPGVDQELIINWGFGGSGHMLSPLPWVPVQLRSTKSTTGSSFSVTDLGIALAQDKLSNQAKQASALKWFAEAQLSPLKLCSLKIFLLAKDFGQRNLDLSQVQAELIRLLVRLSLTDDLGIIDPSKPFSSCMPDIIKELINKRMPWALSTMDNVLEMLMIDKHSGIVGFTDKLPRTVYASPFKTEVSANLYFDSLQGFPLQHFINNKGILQFDGLTATYTPADMPVELKQAALAAITLPQLIKVKTADNQHWIGCVTDRIGMTSTATLTCAALLATIKEYVVIRKTYLAQHPEEALKLKNKQEAAQQQTRRLHAFGKTEAGIASLARLTKEIDAIKNAPKTNPAQIKAAEDIARLKVLEQELSTLKDKEVSINRQLAMNAQAMKSATKARKATLQKRIDLLNNDLATLQAAIEEKEADITTLTLSEQFAELSRQEQKVDSDTIQNDTQALAELVALAASLKKNGDPVPADLVSMIQELEAKLQAAKEAPAEEMSLDNRLSQRETIALVYRQEALLLENEVAQRLADIKTIPQATKRRIDEIRFGTVEKPLFQARITQLNQEADLIIDQNEKMLDLQGYRESFALQNPMDIAAEDKIQCRALEFEVGMLLDNNGADLALDAGSDKGLLYALLYDNPEINELLQNLSGDNPVYAPVKERLFSMLGLIAQKSDHIKEFASTYRYLIAKGLPDFLPLFDHILNSLAQ